MAPELCAACGHPDVAHKLLIDEDTQDYYTPCLHATEAGPCPCNLFIPGDQC